METKIIKAVFGGSRYTVAAKRTRTDYGQVLEFVGVDLPDTFECIFSNSSTSAGVGKKMIGSAQRVLIPDEYLTTGQTIYAWILLHDGEDDGRHMYNVKIPVADMPNLSPEEPTPVEQSIISQAITALNSAVTTTTQKAQEATESADRAEQAAEGAEGYAERAEAAQSAAESARDIALEAKVSAQASAATATEKASEAISSATTASQSALTAESASESAQESATASAESASQASQSADTASGKASDASEYASNANTSAQTASQKALEAAQSASTATQAKTDAETAKTASETAQGLAESARDGAVSAKTGAEDARDEAQDIVDGITNKIEQIDSNTERIESLEDDRYKPYAVDTASGAVASFPDGADDIPLKSCIVRVEPVQDLHGYDHPWPAGGGKNLLKPPSSGGTINGVTFVINNDETVVANGTSGSSYNTDLYFIGGPSTYENVNIPSGDYILTGCGTTATVGRFYVIEEGSTPKTQENNVPLNIALDNTKKYRMFIRIFSGQTVTNQKYKMMIRLASVTDASYAPYSNECPISGFTGCEVKHSGADTSNPTTYPITFPTEAGTVYGGYVDVINGDIVADMAIVDMGTCNIKEYVDTGITNHLYSATLPDKLPYYDNNVVPVHLKCSALKPIEIARPISFLKVLEPNTVAIRITYTDRVYIMSEIETVEAMKQSLDGVQLCYELAEPIHYPLAPTEIKTLLGQNNIWADCGDTEVEYRANVTLYINKKIAEAISALS